MYIPSPHRTKHDNMKSMARSEGQVIEMVPFETPQILCVDDDPEVARMIDLRLQRFNVDVVPAYFGMHGFWGATTDHPDLVIVDLAMPNGDGEFVIKSLRANNGTQDIPIVVLTGMSDRKLRKRILALGADEYLRKPINFDELLRSIEKYIPLTEIRPGAGELHRIDQANKRSG